MAQDHLDTLDYYSLLEVEHTASVEAIRAAFRKFALKFHPDRHAGSPPEKVARATAIYRRGSEALETLVDPIKRKAYDVVLSRGELRLTTDAQTIARGGPGGGSGTAKTTRSGARKSSVGASRPARRRSIAPGAPKAAEAKAKPALNKEIQSPTAKAFYARALQASKGQDYKSAMRMIDAAIEQEPGHPLLLEAKKRLLPYMDN